MNKILFEIINKLLIKMNEFKIVFSNKKNGIYLLYEKAVKDLIDNKILDNLNKCDFGYYTKIKYKLLYIIEIITELYHYFKYCLNNGKEPYNKFYWEYVKDPIIYIKERINEFKKSIENIHKILVENKSSNYNINSNSMEIHIVTNNSNIQMDQ